MKNETDPLGELVRQLNSHLTHTFSEPPLISQSKDPYQEIQRVFLMLIDWVNQRDEDCHKDLQEQTQSNEFVILESLKALFSANQQISAFSKQLFEAQYPHSVYKSFRKLYEAINKVSTSLYEFDSINVNFLNEKEQLMNQNLTVCEQIYKGIPENCTNKQQSEGKTESQDEDSVINRLRAEIIQLNDILKQNDEQFGIQIEKYNATIYDLQETVREYELRMDRIHEYEAIIDNLEYKIIRIKEEKYRDDMLIDNMSKKIRAYEKERGGFDAFVSPRGSNNMSNSRFSSRKMLASPSNRFISPNSGLYSPDLTHKHPKNTTRLAG